MIALPMFSCTQVVAVLGMASSVKNAFRRCVVRRAFREVMIQ